MNPTNDVHKRVLPTHWAAVIPSILQPRLISLEHDTVCARREGERHMLYDLERSYVYPKIGLDEEQRSKTRHNSVMYVLLLVGLRRDNAEPEARERNHRVTCVRFVDPPVGALSGESTQEWDVVKCILLFDATWCVQTNKNR